MRTAVFTVASYNYFAFVETLMQSLMLTNPSWDRYAVLVDECRQDANELLSGRFQLITIDGINLPNSKQMKFRYDILELNTAVKPFAIEMLFTQYGYERVIYLDPDIYVYNKMEEVEDAFSRGYSFILTPHLTKELDDDGYEPNELAILRSGIYNLGFIALQNTPDVKRMIQWWKKKLIKQCIDDQTKGLFVDQKWIDFVPSRYSGVYILLHEGYNVAYWNLEQRKLFEDEKGYYSNGVPLVFFHFSGFMLEKKVLSKYTNRLFTDNQDIICELKDSYKSMLLSNHYTEWNCIPYAYGMFSDGSKILKIHRLTYRNCDYLQRICGKDPFLCSSMFEKEYLDKERILFDRYINLKLEEFSKFDNLIIFGAGNIGKRVYGCLQKHGLHHKLLCFCDNNAEKIHKLFGVDVVLPEDAMNRFPTGLFIITPVESRREILHQLLSNRINAQNISIFSSSLAGWL